MKSIASKRHQVVFDKCEMRFYDYLILLKGLIEKIRIYLISQ